MSIPMRHHETVLAQLTTGLTHPTPTAIAAAHTNEASR